MISNLNMATPLSESGFSYNELPSERFHDWLNSNFISVSIYDSDCNSLDYSYKNNYGIKKLCAKVVKYIKSKPSITNIKHLKDHHCNLFNYWIYEQLVNECKDKSIKPALVFGNFLLVLSGMEYYQKENTCELDNKVATIPDITDRRKLYEYCVDCKTILDNYKHSKEKCQKYYTYVKKKIELYKKFHKLCSPDYESKCPDLYKICDNCDPSVLLAQLKCDEIGVNDKALHEVAPGTTRNTSPSIESVSNLGNAFLGVVVTSMTSGFLYKFTPLGTRIRNGLLWNSNNISNLNTNGDELFVQESYSPYAGEEQHYIGYHAS